MGVRIRHRDVQKYKRERIKYRMISLVGILGIFALINFVSTQASGLKASLNLNVPKFSEIGLGSLFSGTTGNDLSSNDIVDSLQASNDARKLSTVTDDFVALVSGSSARRLATPEECFNEHPEFCAGGCLAREELEGACCRAFEDDNIATAEECITIEETVCVFQDLCVAELLPGSGVGAQCLRQFERNGGIPLYIFLLLYLFLALAIVCDDYFSFSLDMLGDALGMTPDVKGATFAAIGSSAPELFVSLADNVISNPPKSVGVGTIVGSAIFNILIIIGLSAIVAGGKSGKEIMKLDWRPLVRDSIFYSISIIGLIAVAVTGQEAREFEGAILLILYGGYLLFMKYNQQIFRRVDKFLGVKPKQPDEEGGDEKDVEGGDNLKLNEVKEVSFATEEQLPNAKGSGAKPIIEDQSEKKKRTEEVDIDIATLDRKEKQAAWKDFDKVPSRRLSYASNIGRLDLNGEDDMSKIPYFINLYWPQWEPKDKDGNLVSENMTFKARYFGGGQKMWSKRFYFLLVFPINFIFRITIPDSRYDLFGEDKEDDAGEKVTTKRMKAYWLEFIACIIHIGILSHFLVFSAAKLGCLIGIAPSVMGLTVLAAGTSVPDAITSIILTRNGEGDAAVANSIGSNVFDILVGLGLPWMLAGFVYGQAEIATDDVAISIGFLFGVLIVLIGTLLWTKFHLTRNIGIFLVALYVLYVLFELLIRPLTGV